jgi:hypothetical protein
VFDCSFPESLRFRDLPDGSGQAATLKFVVPFGWWFRQAQPAAQPRQALSPILFFEY